MKLPRSLREVTSAVRKSGTGAAIIDMGRKASDWQQLQGTRSFPGQGTMASGNTPDPLTPGRTLTPDRPVGWDDPNSTLPYGVFSTETPTVNLQGAGATVRDWPPNVSRDSIAPSVGHSEQIRTDGDFQRGKGPGRIDRQMPERVFGVVGITTGQRGGEYGYDSMADKDFLAHIPTPRQALGVKGPGKVSDDNAVIPAIYAGNPRA